MRFTLVALPLMFLCMAVHLAKSDGGYGYADDYDDQPRLQGVGTALAAILAIEKIKFLGVIKGLFLAPLALLALAKLKIMLILGKPLILLFLKKLLLKTLLGGLLLKLPLLLLAKKLALAKLLALKFALIAKGLIGLKAPIILLIVGAAALGKGLLTTGSFKQIPDDDYSYGYGYDVPAYAPPVSYGTPIYTPHAPPSPYRKRRDIDDSSEESEEDDGDDIVSQFKAARSNGGAYLDMATHFDQQACGRRLMCEIYQKPRSSLSDNEIFLQELFG